MPKPFTNALRALPARVRKQAVPPLVGQINDGNWLSETEAESLPDELYYQRAVHAYMTMLPALNTIGMRDGSEATFGSGYNVLPIWATMTDTLAFCPLAG